MKLTSKSTQTERLLSVLVRCMILRRIIREIQLMLLGAYCTSRTWRKWCFFTLLISFQTHTHSQNANPLQKWRSFHLFQNEQKSLVRNLARAVENRVQKVNQDPSNWTCRCAYHQCGEFFRGPGECYHLDAPLDKNTCPRNHVNCSPYLVSITCSENMKFTHITQKFL